MSLWGDSWSLVKRSEVFIKKCDTVDPQLNMIISQYMYALTILMFIIYTVYRNISGAQLQRRRVWWRGGSSSRRREENPVKRPPMGGNQRKPVKIALSSVRKSTVFLECYLSDLDAKISGNSPAMYCICNRQSMSFSRACRNTSNIVHSLIIWWSHRLGLSEVCTIVSWAWDKLSYISFYT